MRLTKTSVEGASAEKADTFHWDDRLPGFGLKITPKGRRIYVVQYRVKGRSQTRRITLGAHGAPWTTEKARVAAEQLLLRARVGEDPVETERATRVAADQAKEDAKLAEQSLFELVVDNFISLYARPKNRRWADANRVIQYDAVSAWKGRPVASITRKDVIELVDRVRERSPSSGRALYAQLRRMFAWCVERQLIEHSPCTGLRAPPSVSSRDRWLSDGEIRHLWASLESEGGPFEPLFKLLLLTGQRREEVTGMRWNEVDFDKSEWIIPRERSKNFAAHAVDLAPACVEILQALPRKSNLVFTTTGETPLSNHAKVRQRYAAKMQSRRNVESAKAGCAPLLIAHWTVHDLRRTVATGMSALGTPPHVVEAILNHRSGSLGGLVGVYQHYQHRAERKTSLFDWADHVLTITSSIEAARS
jgi:integrase